MSVYLNCGNIKIKHIDMYIMGYMRGTTQRTVTQTALIVTLFL